MGYQQERKWTAMLLIMLVVAMPLSSASALAVSVRITHNSGEDNLEGFMDGAGDVWTLKALVTGAAAEVAASDVKITLGGTTDEFDTCGTTSLGTECEYISDLRGGVAQGSYSFDVKHVISGAADGATIAADVSEPVITTIAVPLQAGEKIALNFRVEDQPAYGVGLSIIEVLDGSSGRVLQSFGPFADRVAAFVFKDEVADGLLAAPADYYAGEGIRTLKVRATDRFGHEAVAILGSPEVDFIVPEVLPATLNFTELGEFMGPVSRETDMIIDVREAGLDLAAEAFSDQLTFVSNDAECDKVEGEGVGDDLWRCVWRDVTVPALSSVQVRIKATDGHGLVGEQLVVKSFTPDTLAPTVEFLGTLRQFNGASYVHNLGNTIVLRVREQGAGIDHTGVALDLSALGGGSLVIPAATDCASDAGLLTCKFSIDASGLVGGRSVQVIVNKLEDKVGNRGELISQELLVDTAAPDVEELNILGVGADGREKDAIQGGDQLRFKMKVRDDGSGVFFKVDTRGIISNAEEHYPASELSDEAGWAVFTEEGNCERNFGLWYCTFTLDQAMDSVHDSHASVSLVVEDTPGNKEENWPAENKGRAELRNARDGEYEFEKLGSLDGSEPDFWEFDKGVNFVGQKVEDGFREYFVNLDTTRLAAARFPMTLRFDARAGNVDALSLDLLGCQAGEKVTIVPEEANGSALVVPSLSRSILYGGTFIDPEHDPEPKLILEFAPFEGKEAFGLGGKDFDYALAEYTCQVRIFSKVGRDAVASPEIEEFSFKVPFAFSSLGGQDEALEAKIKALKEEVDTGILGVIGDLEGVLKWLHYIGNALSTAMGLYSLVNGAQAVGDSLDIVDVFTGGVPIGTVEKVTFCLGIAGAEKTTHEVISTIMIPVNILSCNYPTGLTWYDQSIGSLLDAYNNLLNIEVGRSPDVQAQYVPKKEGGEERVGGVTYKYARNVRDNLYLSGLALCLPGIIHNVDKYRQILCREIVCLEQEVPAGYATVDTCAKLTEVLTCKYFIGELWYVIPFSAVWDTLVHIFRDSWADPVAILHSSTLLYCGLTCASKGGATLSSQCVFLYYLWDWVDWIERVVNIITTLIDEADSGGLQYCDMVLNDDEDVEALAESTTPEDLEAARNVPAAPTEGPGTES